MRKSIARWSAIAVVCLLVLAVPVTAEAKPRDWHADVQSFKEAALDAYFAVDSYLTNTDANLPECDSALAFEQAGTEGDWSAAEGNADENLNVMSPNTRIAVNILLSTTKDFMPWRGPGQLTQSGERNYNNRAKQLRDDVRRWYSLVDTLDLANTMVKAHECGPARAQVVNARADLDLTRRVLYFVFGKLKNSVDKKN